VTYKSGAKPPAGRAGTMTDAQITGAAQMDPDTELLDENFIRSGLRFFSPDGQRRFIITPEDSVLEVDEHNRILGLMSKFPGHMTWQ